MNYFTITIFPWNSNSTQVWPHLLGTQTGPHLFTLLPPPPMGFGTLRTQGHDGLAHSGLPKPLLPHKDPISRSLLDHFLLNFPVIIVLSGPANWGPCTDSLVPSSLSNPVPMLFSTFMGTSDGDNQVFLMALVIQPTRD